MPESSKSFERLLGVAICFHEELTLCKVLTFFVVKKILFF